MNRRAGAAFLSAREIHADSPPFRLLSSVSSGSLCHHALHHHCVYLDILIE